MLTVLKTVEQARQFSSKVSGAGQRLALVPTMGFLHEGHLGLMREGSRRADAVAATIFVNPTQFGPNEDLSRYPRDLEGDLAKCEREGISAVFTPLAAELYPTGYQTTVEVGQLSQGLCGARRPGHFAGVATVVTKLLAIFRPQVALFGEKDYQQLAVIRRLNADLNLGAQIVGVSTAREPDGLAMSSRNSLLKPDERQRAVALSRGLLAAQRLAASGERDSQKLIETVRQLLKAADLREDYIELVDAQSLKPLQTLQPGVPARALVAAFVGSTRLIDNVGVALS